MINSEKQAAMFARVDEWEKSGKAMREFASGIGLSKSCFEYWVRKKRNSTESSPKFVELIPSGKPMADIEQKSKTNESPTQAQIVFTFPGGLCVKVYG
jgi:transposase-like protein